jgi:hypothetical protein
MRSRLIIVILILLTAFASANILVRIYSQISSNNQVITGSIFPTQQLPTCSNNPFPKFEPAVIYEPINTPAGKGGYLTNLLAGSLLANAKTNFVFRGFFWWGHCPNWWPWQSSLLLGGQDFPCTYQGQLNSLNALSDEIKVLKQKNPNLIFAGGMTTSHLESKDTWTNGTPIGLNYDNMCAHDSKGNTIDFFGGCMANFSSSQYRQFIIGWANKIVDSGVDAIWFDQICMYEKYHIGSGSVDKMLSDCANNFGEIARAVRLHASQSGRSILISFNWNAGGISDLYNGGHEDGVRLLTQNVNYVMASTNPGDFNTTSPYVLTEDWPTVKKAVGNLPIVTYLDWSGSCNWCQLYKFAQLSKQNQINYLSAVDADTKNNEIIFAYPMWGGSDQMTTDRYDSVRDGTYDTIAQLSNSTVPCSTTSTTTTIAIQKDLYDPFPNNDNAYGFYCVLSKPKLYGFKYSIWEFQEIKQYKSVFELISETEKYENHGCDFLNNCSSDELQFDKNILNIRSPLPSASLKRSDSLILLNIDYPEKNLYLNLTLKRGPIHYWSSNNFDSMDSVLEGKITLDGVTSDVKGLCTFAHWYTPEDFKFSNKMSFYDEVFWNWSYSSDVWIVTSLENMTSYYPGGTTLTDGNHKLFQPSQIIFNYSETTPEDAPKGWTVITKSGPSYKSKVLSTNSPEIVNLNGTQIALNLFLTSSELTLNGIVYYGFGLTEFPAPTFITTSTTTSMTTKTTTTFTSSTTITSSTTTTAISVTSTTTPQVSSTTSNKITTTQTSTTTPSSPPCSTYDIPCWIGYFILRIFGLIK